MNIAKCGHPVDGWYGRGKSRLERLTLVVCIDCARSKAPVYTDRYGGSKHCLVPIIDYKRVAPTVRNGPVSERGR